MSLTLKQETFVNEWIATGNKSEAYRIAYDAENMSDEAINTEAYKLSINPQITLRHEELTKASQKRNETTIDTIDGMLKSAWKLAKEQGQPASMVSAANGLAKVHGLIVDKSKLVTDDGKGGDAPIGSTTPEQTKQILTELLSDAPR